MEKRLVELSKLISYILRHKPEEFGLKLDSMGWISISDLFESIHLHRPKYSWAKSSVLNEISKISDKQRFEIQDDRIRAYYGHSASDRISMLPVEPPEYLFHGTTRKAADKILKDGLKSMQRQYVHLSTDEKTAVIVAKRRTSQPVILKVCAQKASVAGICFYHGNEDIWLSDPIGAEHLSEVYHNNV